jgi:hypothetical protein
MVLISMSPGARSEFKIADTPFHSILCPAHNYAFVLPADPDEERG